MHGFVEAPVCIRAKNFELSAHNGGLNPLHRAVSLCQNAAKPVVYRCHNMRLTFPAVRLKRGSRAALMAFRV